MRPPKPKGIVASRYWSTNGMGIAIVAVRGRINDIAAYIGASEEGAEYEEAALDWTINHGAKLTREDALRMLPTLAEIFRLAELAKEPGFHYRD